jgi:hypothetical protein
MQEEIDRMSADLGPILQDWPFEPGRLSVRVITGNDGRPKVQLRLDLGLIQMEYDGRPDGQRPHGYRSYLEYCEARMDEEAESFNLSPEDCQELREEATQYYHRYIALLVLEDFEAVYRDATRNLRVLDLCARHGPTESDRSSMEQYRPYITMMRARALAGMAIAANEPKAAMVAIDEALDALHSYFDEHGRPELFDNSTEVQALRGMRDSLVPRLPVSQKTELKQRLAMALEQENYELAAILRDELKQLPE